MPVGAQTRPALPITICLLGVLAVTFLFPSARHARAGTLTECTTINFCYCFNEEQKQRIDNNVAVVRKAISEFRQAGRAIGYLSVPLSSSGGGFFGINADLAAHAKAALEEKLGPASVWILNPGTPGLQGYTDLSEGGAASGADYMYMWTRILEGPAGLGEDFDFFYFVGPSDFARFFSLQGKNDMEVIDKFFDSRLKSDPKFKAAVDAGKVSKTGFRNYYALRASVSFSYGAHDEWNIAQTVNQRRRGAAQYGISNQLPVLFDGHSVPMSTSETTVAPGTVGRCVN